MKKFINLNGKAYKTKLIQGFEKFDNLKAGVWEKRKDAKWYSLNKYIFKPRPLYSIILEYGTNKLKKIPGHWEYSDMIASEFYVETDYERDTEEIKIDFLSAEERDKEYYMIYDILNGIEEFKL